MKYYIIAGEASGDLHGSNLMRALQKEDQEGNFRFWGGDLMEEVGGKQVKHYRDLAFMGFLEVVGNLRTILNNLQFCKKDIFEYRPDVLILIDYPGFNLRIASWAHQQGIRVFYYISPQIWAWRSSRALKIKQIVDRMFVILPFEEDFYEKYNCEVDFVGHPLLDVVEHYPKKTEFLKKHNITKPIIALLPGSRRQEIKNMLPVMLQMVPKFHGYQFVLAGAPAIPHSFYSTIAYGSKLSWGDQIKIVENRTYDLLCHAQAALVTSGTATLETALFRVPQVVCYRGNPISYWIARQLVHVKYIALVNLIMDQPLVKELIQKDFNPRSLEKELASLLQAKTQENLQKAYMDLRKKLGEAGASERAAKLMVKYLRTSII